MLGKDQRRSVRVPFQVPVRVLGSLRALDGQVEDLSRTGARLSLPLAPLRLGERYGLADLAARFQEVVEPECQVHLHHVALGCLLAKRSNLVRIAVSPDSSDRFEAGYDFQVPLSNEETVMLGVALPPMPGSAKDWLPRADAVGPTTRTPRAEAPPPAPEEVAKRLSGRQILRWRGFVSPTGAGGARALPCALDEVSRVSVRLRVLRNPGTEGAAILGNDPASAGIAFSERYGERVDLRLTDGPADLWRGPAQVRAVEVPQGMMRDLILTLEFDRGLTPPELNRLGLA